MQAPVMLFLFSLVWPLVGLGPEDFNFARELREVAGLNFCSFKLAYECPILKLLGSHALAKWPAAFGPIFRVYSVLSTSVRTDIPGHASRIRLLCYHIENATPAKMLFLAWRGDSAMGN